jgi:hypothetical protein
MIKPGMRVATYAEKVGDRRLAMNDLPWFAAVKGFLRLVPGRG